MGAASGTGLPESLKDTFGSFNVGRGRLRSPGAQEATGSPCGWDNGCVGRQAESKTSAGSLEQGTAEVGACLELCASGRTR